AGTYAFKAMYNGDANYRAVTSSCEPFTVNPAQLAISTTIHNAAHAAVGGATTVPLGSVVHDTATVTGQVGGFTPTGAITFAFYTTIGCTGTATAPATDTSADAGTTAHSAATVALAAGGYSYTASVAGDNNYVGAGPSACEPLTVSPAPLAITTTIHNAAHAAVGGAITVPLGSVVHDTATVTGQIGGFTPTGAITFAF